MNAYIDIESRIDITMFKYNDAIPIFHRLLDFNMNPKEKFLNSLSRFSDSTRN